MLSLLSCAGDSFVQERIGYLNRHEASLYLYNDDPSTFAGLDHCVSFDDAAEIGRAKDYLCISINAHGDISSLSREKLDEIYECFEKAEYVWICFFGAESFDFLSYSRFDNEKHYIDAGGSALHCWFSSNGGDSVSEKGYDIGPGSYGKDYYRRTLISFYTDEVKNVVGSR